MKSSSVKKLLTQELNHEFTQLPLIGGGYKKGVGRKASYPKLYEYRALEIAEEYEQALEANSLEKLTVLLDKLI